MKYIYIILLVVAVISRAEGVNENDATFKLLKKLQGYMEIQATSTKMDIATILRTFEYLHDKLDNLDGSLNDITRNIEEIDQKFTSKFTEMDQKYTDAELRDASLKEQISSMKEDAELRDASLKEQISSMKEDAELRDESLKEELSSMKEEMQEGLLQVLRPVDCKAILNFGRNQSRVYTIYPVGMPGGVNVYCDQESDGGGWIVFLQRQKQKSQVDFARTFEDYAKGFGEPGQEFWLGNRILHAITGTSNYELRVEATSLEGDTRHGTWLKFSVGSEDTQFTLTVDDYDVSQSSLGDGLSSKDGARGQSNQMKFSTYDKDASKEYFSVGCSSMYGRVGWWMDDCMGALPTALIIGESSSPWGIFWVYWEKNSSLYDTNLSWVQMKIRAQ